MSAAAPTAALFTPCRAPADPPTPPTPADAGPWQAGPTLADPTGLAAQAALATHPATDSPPGRLLLLEPAAPRREALLRLLRAAGHQVQARTQADDLARAAQQGFELILLNPGTPVREPQHAGDDAWWRLRALRHHCPRLPVLVVQPLADSADRTVALELGADAVLDAQAPARELLARVRALLRRQREPRRPGLADAAGAGWLLDGQRHRVQTPDGHWHDLSRSEHSLLRALMQQPEQVLSRDQLQAALHGPGAALADRGIDLLVSRLRARLDDRDRLLPVIATQRGAGYSFHPRRWPAAAGAGTPGAAAAAGATTAADPADAAVAAGLATPPSATGCASDTQHRRYAPLTAGDEDVITGKASLNADPLGLPVRAHPAVSRVGKHGVHP